MLQNIKFQFTGNDNYLIKELSKTKQNLLKDA